MVWPLHAHRRPTSSAGCQGVALAPPWSAALASAVLRIGSWRTTAAPTPRVYFGLDTHADGLLLGCALAALTLLWPGLPAAVHRPRRRRWIGPVALVALGVAAATSA